MIRASAGIANPSIQAALVDASASYQ